MSLFWRKHLWSVMVIWWQGILILQKFSSLCSALEHLLLDLFNAEFYADVAPTRLRFDLNSVKRFFLRDIMLESYRLSCALRLIKSLPSLEYLEIKIYSEANEYGAELLELEHFSDVTFNHLKEVKLDCFTGATSEMQLIKLLLAKSPVLVRMRINPWLHNKPPDSKVLSVLSKYLHATPEAEVVFIS